MTNQDFASAVNKFFYYSMNYDSKPFEVKNLNGKMETIYLPSCFEVFKDDNYLLLHFADKFEGCYEKYGCMGVFNSFYGGLSDNNRLKLLSWINENYENYNL